ncbi:MAG TPA: DUF1292 domain-containing protein [Bacilli bacterium]
MSKQNAPLAAQQTRLLRDKFGDVVELADDRGANVEHRILYECSLHGRNYAVLQSETLKKEDEYAIFRAVLDEHGETQLETIEDDDEWDEVAEMYDDFLFSLISADEDDK